MRPRYWKNDGFPIFFNNPNKTRLFQIQIRSFCKREHIFNDSHSHRFPSEARNFSFGNYLLPNFKISKRPSKKAFKCEFDEMKFWISFEKLKTTEQFMKYDEMEKMISKINLWFPNFPSWIKSITARLQTEQSVCVCGAKSGVCAQREDHSEAH